MRLIYFATILLIAACSGEAFRSGEASFGASGAAGDVSVISDAGKLPVAGASDSDSTSGNGGSAGVQEPVPGASGESGGSGVSVSAGGSETPVSSGDAGQSQAEAGQGGSGAVDIGGSAGEPSSSGTGGTPDEVDGTELPPIDWSSLLFQDDFEGVSLVGKMPPNWEAIGSAGQWSVKSDLSNAQSFAPSAETDGVNLAWTKDHVWGDSAIQISIRANEKTKPNTRIYVGMRAYSAQGGLEYVYTWVEPHGQATVGAYVGGSSVEFEKAVSIPGIPSGVWYNVILVIRGNTVAAAVGTGPPEEYEVYFSRDVELGLAQSQGAVVLGVENGLADFDNVRVWSLK